MRRMTERIDRIDAADGNTLTTKWFNELAAVWRRCWSSIGFGKGSRHMTGFGNWLNESKLNLMEITTLRNSITGLPGWQDIKSDKIAEYALILRRISCSRNRTVALDSLYNLWPLYETQQNRSRSGVSATGWVVAFVSALLLLLIWWVLTHIGTASGQINLGDINTRGLLAFLFGLTTVGIIIIVVVAIFFESGETTLDQRFQRGKDILTILIGLLGVILGYYFGQANAYADKHGGQAVSTDGTNTSGRSNPSGAAAK